MPNFNTRVIVWFRHKKEKPLKKTAQFLVKKGVTANMVTFASFFAGIIAIYFLFENHLLFIIFALLHLFFDALDGVVARLTKPTIWGKTFDLLVDRLVNLGALLKIAFYFKNSLINIIILIVILSQGIYFFTKFKSPVYFTRTTVLLLLIIKIPLIAVSFAGIINLYGLYKQWKWYKRKKRSIFLKKQSSR